MNTITNMTDKQTESIAGEQKENRYKKLFQRQLDPHDVHAVVRQSFADLQQNRVTPTSLTPLLEQEALRKQSTLQREKTISDRAKIDVQLKKSDRDAVDVINAQTLKLKKSPMIALARGAVQTATDIGSQKSKNYSLGEVTQLTCAYGVKVVTPLFIAASNQRVNGVIMTSLVAKAAGEKLETYASQLSDKDRQTLEENWGPRDELGLSPSTVLKMSEYAGKVMQIPGDVLTTVYDRIAAKADEWIESAHAKHTSQDDS